MSLITLLPTRNSVDTEFAHLKVAHLKDKEDSCFFIAYYYMCNDKRYPIDSVLDKFEVNDVSVLKVVGLLKKELSLKVRDMVPAEYYNRSENLRRLISFDLKRKLQNKTKEI